MRQRFQQPPEWQWGIMNNADHAGLRYGALARHAKPRANIIIGPGLSEFSHKYFETARILSRLHYNVYILHWRGQGGSAPYLSDRFLRHSLGFDRDARDLLQFTDQIVPDDAPKVLLSHSMGGLISTLALKQAPHQFAAAILTAPLYGFQHAFGKRFEAFLAWLPLPQKLREYYMPGGGPWKPRHDPNSDKKPEAFSSDPDRNILHDHWMCAEPSLRIGSPTMGFVGEASRALISLRQPGQVEQITTPLLIFSAGRDEIVRNAPIFNLAARVTQAQHIHLPEARHEIMLERASIRRPVMKTIHNFIMSNIA